MEDKAITGSAFGKIILIGEHSVVYGKPAISLPFKAIEARVQIEESLGPVFIDCEFYKGYLHRSEESVAWLKVIIEDIVKNFGEKPENFTVRIKSTIPPERGMGSSAAVSISLIKALYSYFDRELTREDLVKYSNISEEIIHGNPSGLDAATIISEESLYYIKGQETQSFKFNLNGYLIVADSGEMGKTKEAVQAVKKSLEDDYINTELSLELLARLTQDAKVAMESGELSKLGKIMTNAHIILDSIGVSDKNLNKLVNLAMQNGALGAKLTGGGRGGSIIVLCQDEKIARKISKKLLDGGAKNTWISYLGDDLYQ